jgi:beta-aspartyl-dipeptidase (metallo-type)
MKLFKRAKVYAPEPLGIKDVLISGGKIIAIEDDIGSLDEKLVEIIDTKGQLLVPGFVDSLVHITGGGGEGGYATRTPEMELRDAVIGGVTTVIGVLGTDSVTRSLENLLAKAHALEEQGISVYCYTGSYHFPVVSITGSVTKDIMLIEKFIGVGEVAISDHRSSQLSAHELARLTSEARIGGMLAGKKGVVSIHVGDESGELSLLHQVAEQSDIPITQFYPTHINRNRSLLIAGIEFAKRGGFIDFTSSTTDQILAQGEVYSAQALAECLNAGVSINQLTMSSDGNASLPVFDAQGNLVDLQVGRVTSLHQSMVKAVLQYGVSIEDALASITKSPANILGLGHKGQIEVNRDADINLLMEDTLDVHTVYAKGVNLTREFTIQKENI